MPAKEALLVYADGEGDRKAGGVMVCIIASEPQRVLRFNWHADGLQECERSGVLLSASMLVAPALGQEAPGVRQAAVAPSGRHRLFVARRLLRRMRRLHLGVDGLLNKNVGDAIMAIFNFLIRRRDHAECAVLAAWEVQRRFRARRELLGGGGTGLDGSELGVGVGIGSGKTSFGEFGRAYRDLTAIGTVVNTAARAQSAARAEQILVTRCVRSGTAPNERN